MPAVLGIDVGEKKIGLAIGQTDMGWAFARPALLVETWDQVWPAIKELVTKESITTIVVGLPLDADGSVGLQAKRTKEFIASLKQQVEIPILERDERLTTQAVQREQQAAGQKLERGDDDSLAAQLLTESYLSEQWL